MNLLEPTVSVILETCVWITSFLKSMRSRCVCVCACVRACACVRVRACMCARICVYSSTGALAILRMLQVCARMVSPPLHNNIVILSYVMILCWHDTDCVTVK